MALFLLPHHFIIQLHHYVMLADFISRKPTIETCINQSFLKTNVFPIEARLQLKGSSLGSRYWLSASHFLTESRAPLVFIPEDHH